MYTCCIDTDVLFHATQEEEIQGFLVMKEKFAEKRKAKSLFG